MSTERLVRPYKQGLRAKISAGLRTRILRAFSDSVSRQWPDEITLDQVAADAQTTRQTVIRLFGSKEGLLFAAIEHWTIEIDACWREPEANSIPMIAAAVVDPYEAFGPTLMRVLALAPRYPQLQAALARRRQSHRLWLEQVLSPSLTNRMPETVERVLCACLVATDTCTWSLLRQALGLSADETKAVVADMLCKALDAAPMGGPARHRVPQGNRAQLLELT